MPAILTHEFFGRDAYDACFETIGMTPGDRDAFLLGNQGPDPLFYLVVDPGMRDFQGVGSLMHQEHPTSVVAAMRLACESLPEDDRPCARAYAAGFLCHYLLDSTVHPFVYEQEYAICDAGVDGLDRSAGTYVHAEIERDLDEMVLYTKLHRTVESFQPYREVLRLDESELEVVGRMYALVLQAVYGVYAPASLFVKAVHDFRVTQHLLYSRRGVKRAALAQVERVARHSHYSLENAMTHRPRAEETSDFDNRDHRSWANPFTGEESHASFWDLYQGALRRAQDSLDGYLAPGFSLEAAADLTDGVNFNGRRTEG